jgi:hypothetical protein
MAKRTVQWSDDADLAVLRLPRWYPDHILAHIEKGGGPMPVDDRAEIRAWDGQVCEVIEERADDTGQPLTVLLLTRDGYLISAYRDEIRSVTPDDEDQS